MSRKIIPFIVAFVLVCLVMAVAGVFAFGGAITAEKFGDTVGWFKQYNAAESMKVIDLTGDGQDELFLQNGSDVTVFDGGGSILSELPYGNPKTTLGDVNGDGVEDIIVYYVGTGMSVDVIDKMKQTTLVNALKALDRMGAFGSRGLRSMISFSLGSKDNEKPSTAAVIICIHRI